MPDDGQHHRAVQCFPPPVSGNIYVILLGWRAGRGDGWRCFEGSFVVHRPRFQRCRYSGADCGRAVRRWESRAVRSRFTNCDVQVVVMTNPDKSALGGLHRCWADLAAAREHAVEAAGGLSGARQAQANELTVQIADALRFVQRLAFVTCAEQRYERQRLQQ